jgi:hypothetical protein
MGRYAAIKKRRGVTKLIPSAILQAVSGHSVSPEKLVNIPSRWDEVYSAIGNNNHKRRRQYSGAQYGSVIVRGVGLIKNISDKRKHRFEV